MNEDVVKILDGNNFIVSDRRGDVDPSPSVPTGLFSLDTRFLSLWRLTVDGERLHPMSVDDLHYFEARFFLVPGEPTHGFDAKMSVIRQRTIGGSFDESLTVLNHSEEPVDITIRIDAGCDCEAVISGDAIIASIAAASIVAKVTRDRLMTRLGLIYPGYGFEQHKGYSVPEHFSALARLGPTVHHRRSFAPVAAAYGDVVTEDMADGGVEPGALPL